MDDSYVDNLRWGNDSIENINKKTADLAPQNTKRCKETTFRQFVAFWKAKRFDFINEKASIESVANAMKSWAFNMKNINGEDYKKEL